MKDKLSKKLTGLSPQEKRALLAKLLQQKSQKTKTPIKTAPVSFGQERMWFLDQLESGSAVYTIRTAVRLTGTLDISILQKSLNEIIRRHEALRTTFHSVDGKPFQKISPDLTMPFLIDSLQTLPVSQRQAEMQRLATLEAQSAFDLAQGPLVRAKLLQLNTQEHVLLVTMHHSISDGWSIGILLREMASLYQAFNQNQASPLPDLTIQYADFATWQRQWLTGDILQKQLDYWKTQLGGDLPPLALPTDHPYPPAQTFQGARQSLNLSSKLSQALKTLSQQADVTLFMTLLAAYTTLLYRYSNQMDITIGTPIAGRNREKVEGVIGLFVNTLAMRIQFSEGMTFHQLLKYVREVALGAYAHQDLPFEKLVETLDITRDVSRNPIFQVFFILQNTPMDTLNIPNLKLEVLRPNKGTAQFEITLALWDAEAGINGYVEYNTDLFEHNTITQMMGHFKTLLTTLINQPHQPLSELSLLTKQEYQQLVVNWNNTTNDYPQNQCLHHVFEAQAQKTPDAVAIVFGEQHLTYRQLNQQANKIAHHLIKQDVKAETRVGLFVERSLEMVIAIFGILKAGGAYVPLDPSYPEKRLAFMLEDSQVAILLTTKTLNQQLPGNNIQILYLETILQRPQINIPNPVINVNPTNLAYIIYTSGSTGTPKGVMGLHKNTINRLEWMWHHLPFNDTEVCCQKTALSFVDSIWEIFGPLLKGIKTVIIDDNTIKHVSRFLETLSTEQITRLVLVPSLLKVILESQPTEHHKLAHLKYCISSGEALPTELVHQFEGYLPHSILFNLYGSSEVAADATYYKTTSSANTTRAPIGQPISNTQIFILDKNLHLMPIGIPGELHVGGSNLSRGYWNRPNLTAQKFIPNPFVNGKKQKQKGQRLYKTGDLARYLPDGNIDYLGRIDHQVKIRGYRIELGEIENTLLKHPAINQVIVTARKDHLGDNQLVAYIVANHQPAPDTNNLRTFLEGVLPNYMVPTFFVIMARFPLTPNGKINHRMLPAPDISDSQSDIFIAPQTEYEILLAKIWQALLGVDEIGIYDNFFALGGHSLLATQLISRIYQQFEVDLPLRSVFEAPTIIKLAETIKTRIQADTSHVISKLLPIQVISRKQNLLLSFSQQRLWLLDQLNPDLATYNVPAIIRLQGDLDIVTLEKAFNQLIEHHETLRTTFSSSEQNQKNVPVQIINPPTPFILPITDLGDIPEEERETEAERLSHKEISTPFNLSTGPLFRLRLLQLDENHYIVVLVIHHIISDGWSMGLIVREMATLYQTYMEDKPASLPKLPFQYADFAMWQRQRLTGDLLESQLAYWKTQLNAAPRLSTIPTDHPRPAVQTYRGASSIIFFL